LSNTITLESADEFAGRQEDEDLSGEECNGRDSESVPQLKAMRISYIIAIATALLLRCASAQTTGQSLETFVQSMHWNPSTQGPLMVLEPGAVKKKQTAEGLAGYERMRVSLPGLSAIVPDTMVVIDDSLEQAPNMYDGLPRHSKVLYLMTTLNADQWEAITGSGLGLSQLTRDQKAVLNSILPRPFVYSTFQVSNDHDVKPAEAGITLSDSDQQAVRLHLERTLMLMLPVVGRPNSVTPRTTRDDGGKPGERVFHCDSEEGFDKRDAFGINMRQTRPNQQKPSGLDYRSSKLSGSIRLNSSERISTLLDRVGQATGFEIRADLRVGDLKMECIGRTAPISSVLKAIALAVTGTYRKVGSAYVLTSDLEGIGTRKLKLAAYDSDLNTKLQTEETLWRSQIYKSGHLNQLRFRADDPLTPDDNLARKLDQGSPGSRTKIGAADLTPSLRDFVERQNQIYQGQQTTADGAYVQSEYQFSYILPSGELTRQETGSLGVHERFALANPEPRRIPQLRTQPKLDLTAIKEPVKLCMVADTVIEAQRAVEQALRYGFKEIWIDTVSNEALTAALSAAPIEKLKVSLAVRPFAYRGPSDAPFADRTLFGDTPLESLERRKADSIWNSASQTPDQSGSITILSKGYLNRVTAVAKLSKAPGLAGVGILNPTPPGYNGLRTTAISISGLYLEKGNFGFAEDIRAAFLREHNIDPIDLCPPGIFTNSDLRQPFFLDDALRGGNTTYDGSEKPDTTMADMLETFDGWLAKKNRGCLEKLLNALAGSGPDFKVSIETIPQAINDAIQFKSEFVDWKSGDPLPEIAAEPLGSRQPEIGTRVMKVSVTDSNSNYPYAILNYMAGNIGNGPRIPGVVLDMTAMTPKQVEAWLSHTLIRLAKDESASGSIARASRLTASLSRPGESSHVTSVGAGSGFVAHTKSDFMPWQVQCNPSRARHRRSRPSCPGGLGGCTRLVRSA